MKKTKLTMLQGRIEPICRRELAQILGVSVGHTYKLELQGRVPHHIKLGSRSVWQPAVLRKWIDDQERAAAITTKELRCCA